MEKTGRSLRTLESLMRKQEWDIAELRLGLSRAIELIEQLSMVIEKVDLMIADVESDLRLSGKGASTISVDVVQRGRRFLLEQQQELAKLLHERQRAEALEQEFVKKLTALRVQMRVYENLSSRKRNTLAAEKEKANMRQLDELSLRKVRR